MKTQDHLRFILGLYFFNDANTQNIWENLQYKKEDIHAILATPDLAKDPAKEFGDERERLVDLLAFTIMPNHYHLIIREIRARGLSQFMQKMGGYTLYFNKQNNRVGPLFQGRYKAVHIKNEDQLRTAFVYVHTNPVELKEPSWKEWKVKDGLAALTHLEKYRWSSYRDYIGMPTFPAVTQRTFFTDFFGGEKECKQAVEDWILFKAENATFDRKQFE